MEILTKEIAELIRRNLQSIDIDKNEIVQSKALELLNEIKHIICNRTPEDCEAVEEIVCLFENCGIYCNGRHDL